MPSEIMPAIRGIAPTKEARVLPPEPEVYLDIRGVNRVEIPYEGN
jgi:hypothetical protein